MLRKITTILLTFVFILSAAPKKIIAVLDLNSESQLANQEPAAFSARMRSLLEDDSSITVLDNYEVKMILEEMAFQQSGASVEEDLSMAVEIGAMLGVHYLLYGVYQKDGQESIALQLCCVSIEDGEVVLKKNYQHQSSVESLLTTKAKTIANEVQSLILK